MAAIFSNIGVPRKKGVICYKILKFFGKSGCFHVLESGTLDSRIKNGDYVTSSTFPNIGVEQGTARKFHANFANHSISAPLGPIVPSKMS